MFDFNQLYDKDFRQALIENPEKYTREWVQLSPGVEVKILKNTKTETYAVFPGEQLDNVALESVNAAISVSTASSVGSAGSLSTAGSANSTFSSFSTAASVGSAGSAGN